MLRRSRLHADSSTHAPRLVLELKKRDCGELVMERREFIALLGLAAAAMPSPASAEPKYPADSLGGRIVGTWSFATSINTRRDGSMFDRWGANPHGIFMFDRGGNYAQIIIGSESRVFGAKTFCAFGTYSIEESTKLLVTRIASCSAAKLTGTTQNRNILKLTPDELRYSNPVTALDAVAEVLWKRVS